MVTLVENQLIPQILGGDDHEEGEISEDEEPPSSSCPLEFNGGDNKLNQILLRTNPQNDGEIDPSRSSLQTAENYINLVTVTNACKSVNDACKHLYDALVILELLTCVVDPSLISKIVDKIRIIYCVYNATGDDQKPQVYQSLRKLATLYSEKLFTPVQLQELRSLLDAIKKPEEPKPSHAYVPWDGDYPEKQPVSSADPLKSYGKYISSSFQMDDLPSPTPSDEDIAARYGEPATSSSINEKPAVNKREAPQIPEELPDNKRQKLGSPSGGWLDPDNEGTSHLETDEELITIEKFDTEEVDEQALKKDMPAMDEQGDLHPELLEILNEMDESERDAVLKERQRRMDEQAKMFNDKKLCLVLDLDLTLLNSAKFNEIEPEWEQYLRSAEALERAKDGKDGTRRELYRSTYMSMWTKLRPGIWRFLSKASQLYELHLYTMGNKAYAKEMAKLLDPTGALFAGRVISKGDDGDALYGDEKTAKSKDLDGVLGMESGVLIIDDSLRVWPHHRDNLIVVERYLYFPCTRRQFALPGPSLLEVGHDERESDGMLASVLGVIESVHREFFARADFRDTDVREILSAVQRSVLGGCKIIFSRIFPVGETQPHLHPLWRMAEQFGARCTTRIEEDVTHVVAISMGTDKCHWALATGRQLVRPAWVEASAALYRRANERDFPVPP